MITVHNKFPKDRINDLPRALFDGRIEVVQSEAEAERAVEILEKATIIGLDTETKPVFNGRRQNKVALLQVSTHDVCFLFRLNMIGLPECITRLLSNESILKIGLSLQDDFRQLRQVRSFSPGGYVELQDFVKGFGIQDLSLQKLYANILGGRISKGQQLTNWEADVLTDAQKGYAATDAWACILLYEQMVRMRAEGFHVVYEPEEVPEAKVISCADFDREREKARAKRTKKTKDESAKVDEAENVEATPAPQTTEPQETPAATEQPEVEAKPEAKKRRKKPARKKKEPAAEASAAEPAAKQETPAKRETPAAAKAEGEAPAKKRRKKPARKKPAADAPAPEAPAKKSAPEKTEPTARRKKSNHRKPKREAPKLVQLDDAPAVPAAVEKKGFMSRLAKKIVDKLT